MTETIPFSIATPELEPERHQFTDEDKLIQRLYDDGVAKRTPLLTLERGPLDTAHNNILIKAEYLQEIGSFKVGCYLDMLQVVEAAPDLLEYDFVAASAGNHAQGVALAAQKLLERGYNASASIYMPEDTPTVKIEAVKARKGRVHLIPGTVNEALIAAKLQPGFFIHPFNSEGVITGNGRIGIEILEDISNPDIIFVPVGGGGALAGISRAIKQRRPGTIVIGVQLERSDAVAQSFYQNQLVTLDQVNGLSDGTAVKSPGDLAMRYIREYADGILTISDADLGTALAYSRGIYPDDDTAYRPLTLEPAGALGLAAALKLEREVPQVKGLNIVVVASGQNADPERVATLIKASEDLITKQRALGGGAFRGFALEQELIS